MTFVIIRGIILFLGFLWYQVIAIFGISIGLHRHFTHRQFDVSKIYEVIIFHKN